MLTRLLRSLARLRRPAATLALLGAAACQPDRATAPVAESPSPVPAASQVNAAARWTVMVYLAADNNLALSGVTDLAEIEEGVADAVARAGGPNTHVQVVVQMEFSRRHLQQAGCGDPSCIGLPNWNTFRYVARGRPAPAPGQPRQFGPSGPVIDIGNRDMTLANELNDFVMWGRSVSPADHYMVVLWNHGGGYTGLIADETSAGDRLMTIDAMRRGLRGHGALDVLAFDMCLMGSYETLAMVDGVARSVVFSEAVVPGAGFEYRSLVRNLEALAATPAIATPRAVAALTADRFHASYADTRETTTISAYDMEGFAAFDASLGALAEELRTRIDVTAPAVRGAAARAQRFDYAMLKDIGDVLDSLRVRADRDDATLVRLIDDVRARATSPSFRVRNLARTGRSERALDVRRATGLDIVLPSGQRDDALRDDGPSSFAAYREMLPGRPWTRFLEAYLGGTTTAVTRTVDQGTGRLETYLVWDSTDAINGADIDYWVLEPDGKLYIPFLGRVTPNGQLTADSWDSRLNFEGWASFRVIARGQYHIFANLAQDARRTRPVFNLAWRLGTGADYQLLYDEHLELSLDRSWLNDPEPTLDKIADGAYTDLQLVASWTPGLTRHQGGAGAAADAADAGEGPLQRAPRARRAAAASADVAVGTSAERRMGGAPRITAAQLRTARELVAARRAADASAPWLAAPGRAGGELPALRRELGGGLGGALPGVRKAAPELR